MAEKIHLDARTLGEQFGTLLADVAHQAREAFVHEALRAIRTVSQLENEGGQRGFKHVQH